MRYYTTQEGDTLENLARRFYSIAPNIPRARNKPVNSIENVLAKIRETHGNEKIGSGELEPDSPICFPSIPGVKSRSLTRQFWHRATKYFVWGLFIAGLCGLIRISLDFDYQALTTAARNLADHTFGDFLVQSLASRFVTQLYLLDLLILVELVLFIFWYFRLSRIIPVSLTYHYVLGWVVGVVVILLLANPILSYVITVSTLGGSFIDPGDIVVSWTIFILALYILFGDDSDAYRANIQERKAIGVSFLLTMLFTFLILNYTYDYIQHRIDGLLAPRESLTADLDNAAAALSHAQAQTVILDTELKSGTVETETVSAAIPLGDCNLSHPANDLSANANTPTSSVLVIPRRLNAVCAYLTSAMTYTQAALDLYAPVETAETELYNQLPTTGSPLLITNQLTVTNLVSVTNDVAVTNVPTATNQISVTNQITATNRLGSSLQWTRITTQDALTLTKAINPTLATLEGTFPPSALPRSPQDYMLSDAIVTDELMPELGAAKASAQRAADAVHGVEIDPRPIFNGSAGLMVLFVLFPWFLLLLFFLRKRNSLASDIIKDLIRLADKHEMLLRVLSLMDVMKHVPTKNDGVVAPPVGENGESGTDAVHPPAANPPAVQNGDGDDAPVMPGTDKQLLATQLELLQSVNALPPMYNGEIDAPSDKDGVYAFAVVKAAIANHAFSDLEYVFAITLLSAAFAVGWFFILFPRTSIGLALLILQNTGIVGFAAYLVSNLTTITAGFAGAYMWSAYTLLRRYYYGDLYPAAYLSALERMIRVFVITLVLAVARVLLPKVVMLPLKDAEFDAVLLLLSFIVGIFPQVGLTFLTDNLNRFLTSQIPSLAERAPLTELDGLDYFVEGRLLEENIENVQGLAAAQIEDLMVNTYFPGKRIVDWIDQAILYIHCGSKGEWFTPLRSVGIRTASDFLDTLGYDVEANPAKMDSLKPEDPSVTRLVAAVSGGQAANGSPFAPPAARFVAVLPPFKSAVDAVVASVNELISLADKIPQTSPDAAARDDADKNVAALGKTNESLGTALKAFSDATAVLSTNLTAMNLPAAESETVSTKISAIKKTMDGLAEPAENLKSNLDAINLEKVDTIKSDAAWRTTISQAGAAVKDVPIQTDTLVQLIKERYTPPLLTAEIIVQMYDAIVPDPNIAHILHWQKDAKPKRVPARSSS